MMNLILYKNTFHIIAVVFILNLPINLYASSTDESLPIFSQLYDAKRDPIKDGIEALNIAKRTNRKVLIEVGGDWCAWCHRLDKFIHSHPQLKKDFFNTFVLLKINVSEANDNQAFLNVFPPANGYPHMYVTDQKGMILESKDTTDFLDNKRYSVKKFYDFINQWKVK